MAGFAHGAYCIAHEKASGAKSTALACSLSSLGSLVRKRGYMMVDAVWTQCEKGVVGSAYRRYGRIAVLVGWERHNGKVIGTEERMARRVASYWGNVGEP